MPQRMRLLFTPLALTLSCRSDSDVVGWGDHASDQTAVACEDLGARIYPVPTRWVVTSQDYLDYLDWLETSPNRADYSEYASGRVRDLVSFDGRLHVGVGDWGLNVGSLFCAEQGGACAYEDAPGHGLPVFTFDRGQDSAAWDVILREEQVSGFRRTGLALLVPGVDPTGGDGRPACAKADADPACPEEQGRLHLTYQIGHFIRYRDGAWTQEPVLEGTYHALDVAVWHGVIYIAGSGQPYDGDDPDGSYAMIWRSLDDGQTWTLDYSDEGADDRRRLTALLPLDEGVIALGKWHTSPDATAIHWVQQGRGWVRQHDALPGLVELGGAEVFDGERGLVWAPTNGIDPTPPRVLWLKDGQIQDQVVALFEEQGWSLVDTWLLCEGDLLTLSRRKRDDGLWDQVVHRTQDLETFEEVVAWQSDTRAYNMALWDGSLVFGSDDGWLLRTPAL